MIFTHESSGFGSKNCSNLSKVVLKSCLNQNKTKNCISNSEDRLGFFTDFEGKHYIESIELPKCLLFNKQASPYVRKLAG